MASIVLAAAMVLSALVVVMPTMAEDVETNLKVVEPQIFALDMSITSAEDFVGTWTNADLESGKMIKFVITQEDSEYYFRGYGACHPTPCDWGTTPLTLYSKSVSDTNDIAGTAEYDSGFKETRIYLVMLNPYVIMAYNFDKFADASGRHNCASMDCFTKVVVPEFSTPKPTPKPTPSTPLLPDLFVSEFSLDPSTPIQGNPVSVRVGVYNKGNVRSGAFTVQWWAGENFREPACIWQVDSMAAQGGRILTCTYDGYRSWYGKLTTKVVVDSAEEVAESNEENNEYRKTISVSRQSTPTPKTHSTGPLTISQTWTADLDEGEVGAGTDSDIWFEAETATERYITPINGATIAKVGTTSVGLGGCLEAPLSSSRININDLPEGTYVCVRTNLGRYSQFRVNEPVGPSPGTLNIGYTTWEAIP